MEVNAKPSFVRFAKVVSLFVLLGGFVGGAATAFIMFVWSMVISPTLTSIPQFLLFLPMASIFGIAFGLPSAAATGVIYALAGHTRRAWLVVTIGAATSAVVGFFLPPLLASSASTSLSQSLLFACVFALAGGAAALACHAHIARWGTA